MAKKKRTKVAPPKLEDRKEKQAEKQSQLFETEEWWEKEWYGMPEFAQGNLMPVKTLSIHFATLEDMRAFAKLVDQKILATTQSIWYPALDQVSMTDWRFVDEDSEK